MSRVTHAHTFHLNGLRGAAPDTCECICVYWRVVAEWLHTTLVNCSVLLIIIPQLFEYWQTVANRMLQSVIASGLRLNNVFTSPANPTEPAICIQSDMYAGAWPMFQACEHSTEPKQTYRTTQRNPADLHTHKLHRTTRESHLSFAKHVRLITEHGIFVLHRQSEPRKS